MKHDAQVDECVYGHERELPPELDTPAECGDQPAYSRDHTNDNAESGPIEIQESRQHIVLHVARNARKEISESNGARGKVLLVFKEELIGIDGDGQDDGIAHLPQADERRTHTSDHDGSAHLPVKEQPKYHTYYHSCAHASYVIAEHCQNGEQQELAPRDVAPGSLRVRSRR